MIDKIRALSKPILSRYREIEEMMKDPHFHERKDFTALSKERRILFPKVEKLLEWEKARESLAHAEELSKSTDQEIAQLARDELESVLPLIQSLEQDILDSLTPKDPLDSKNILLEIRAGTGGEEAALFASDLARMYLRYAEEQGFRHELVDVSLTGRAGFKEAIYFIESKPGLAAEVGPYSHFKYERGVHRVQRVPETEALSLIHI